MRSTGRLIAPAILPRRPGTRRTPVSLCFAVFRGGEPFIVAVLRVLAFCFLPPPTDSSAGTGNFPKAHVSFPRLREVSAWALLFVLLPWNGHPHLLYCRGMPERK